MIRGMFHGSIAFEKKRGNVFRALYAAKTAVQAKRFPSFLFPADGYPKKDDRPASIFATPEGFSCLLLDSQ